MQTDYANDYTKLDRTFDMHEWNRLFNDYIDATRAENRATEKERLEKLNSEITEEKQVTDLSLWELFFNMKDAVNDIFSDMLELKFSRQTLQRNNNVFYLGLFIILVVVLFYIIDILFSGDSKKSESNTKTTRIIHEYRMRK